MLARGAPLLGLGTENDTLGSELSNSKEPRHTGKGRLHTPPFPRQGGKHPVRVAFCKRLNHDEMP